MDYRAIELSADRLNGQLAQCEGERGVHLIAASRNKYEEGGMDRGTATDDRAARIGLSILQYVLKDYHPRDFSVRMWDGSVWNAEAGQPVRFTMVIRHPGAVRSMFTSPSDRSLGQAFVYEDFDIEGDLESAFPMAEHLSALRLGVVDRIRLASQLFTLPPLKVPRTGRQAARLKGETHSIERDREAVTYHYNTSNDFFALYLDKRMVYSCAYFASLDEDLDSAQERKLDYICRKLRLKRGDRLLDIGCGWAD